MEAQRLHRDLRNAVQFFLRDLEVGAANGVHLGLLHEVQAVSDRGQRVVFVVRRDYIWPLHTNVDQHDSCGFELNLYW